MSITVNEVSKERYIELSLNGSVNYNSGEVIYTSLLASIQKHVGALFLFDVSKLAGRPSILQSIQTIDNIPQERIRQMGKVAVVDPITDRSTYLVAESLMQTRGLRIKWFASQEAALEWLLDDTQG
jgi:hypothetical protein